MARSLKDIVSGVRKGVEAICSTDRTTRVKAEEQFQALSLNEYPSLVFALGEIMKDNSTPVGNQVRQQAGVLMQQCIKPRNPQLRPKYAQLWTQQADRFKNQVKVQLVQAMGLAGQEGALLSRSAASCLAEIAILEIPLKSWPQFATQMNQLCSTAEKDEAAVALRKNSCLLIGLACDQLSPQHFTQAEVDSLLTSIGRCMSSQRPLVVGAAMDALTKSLKFLSNNLAQEVQRNHIMKQIINKGVMSKAPKAQEKALQCLVSLCDFSFYQYMPAYMQTIMAHTVEIVKNPASADPVKIQAIEVWNTLLDVELELDNEKSHNIMRKYGLHLVPVLMQAMMYRTRATAESDDICPELSARCAMQLLASLITSTEILKKVMSLVGVCLPLTPDKWAQREVAFIGIGTVMEVGYDTTTAASIKQYISPCVQSIFKCVENKAELVITRDSALWALQRIYVFALNQFPDPKMALQSLATVLKIAQTSTEPQLVFRAVDCIRSYHKFFTHLQPAEMAPNVKTFCPPNVHKHVLKTIVGLAVQRKNMLFEKNIGLNIFDCLSHVIKVPTLISDSLAQDQSQLEYYTTTQQMYSFIVKSLDGVVKDQQMTKEMKHLYAAGYCINLGPLLRVFEVKHDGVQKAIKQNSLAVTEHLLKCCFTMMKWSNAETVQPEALYVMTSIISVLGQNAQKYAAAVMENMRRLMEQKYGVDEMILAIGLMNEVYTIQWEASDADHDKNLMFLMKLMGDNTLSRETKPLILEGMTCMLTLLKDKFLKYLKIVYGVLIHAMQVAKPSGEDDESREVADFVDKLREEILLFFLELAQNPAASRTFGPDIQRALGKFFLTLAQDVSITIDSTIATTMQALIEDFNRFHPVTKELLQKLREQPAMQPYFTN